MFCDNVEKLATLMSAGMFAELQSLYFRQMVPSDPHICKGIGGTGVDEENTIVEDGKIEEEGTIIEEESTAEGATEEEGMLVNWIVEEGILVEEGMDEEKGAKKDDEGITEDVEVTSNGVGSAICILGPTHLFPLVCWLISDE